MMKANIYEQGIFNAPNFKEFIIKLSLSTPTYTATLKYMLTTLYCI